MAVSSSEVLPQLEHFLTHQGGKSSLASSLQLETNQRPSDLFKNSRIFCPGTDCRPKSLLPFCLGVCEVSSMRAGLPSGPTKIKP